LTIHRVSLLLILAFSSVRAAEMPSEQDRLVATGRLWNTVEYFHPYLGYRDIDWSGALLRALPAIRSATTLDAYRAAIRELTNALGDSETSVSDESVAPSPQKRDQPAGTPVRSRVHFGLHEPAFVINSKAGEEFIILPMGGGITAKVRLQEPYATDLPVSLKSASSKHVETDPLYPGTEGRILAAFKLWGAVRFFFAYRDLMDEDWDQAFEQFLPKWMAAKDAREFHLAVAEAATHLSDSGVNVHSSTLDDFFGVASPGLRVELIDKKPVITGIYDEAATTAGVKIGDLVTTVDGENIVDQIKREADYIPFSTQQALSATVTRKLLNGPLNSDATLVVASPGSENKTLKLKREPQEAMLARPNRTGDPVRWLTPSIGYIDLERLADDQVTAAFARFKEAKAILFDGRGKTLASPGNLASQLSDKRDLACCIVTGPLWLAPDEPTTQSLIHTSSFFRLERVPAATSGTHFGGKTAMLIDGRTTGNTELFGLMMGAATNGALIGTASAGSVSDTETIDLPGQITVTFSTSDVRSANGGKLQRLGLQPTLVVPVTVGDLRSGKDEPLAKAIEFLSE
jgi:C-terminal processing protease CtpA/Prc